MEEGAEILSEPEVRDDWSKTKASGPSSIAVFMSSQQLWLPAQGPVSTHSSMEGKDSRAFTCS